MQEDDPKEEGKEGQISGESQQPKVGDLGKEKPAQKEKDPKQAGPAEINLSEEEIKNIQISSLADKYKDLEQQKEATKQI